MDSLVVAPWTVCSLPGFSVHGILPGNIPNPWIEPASPALQANSLPAELQEKPLVKECALSCSAACGIVVPQPEMDLKSPALGGRFLTTWPPGKFLLVFKVYIFAGILYLEKDKGRIKPKLVQSLNL